MCVCLFLKRVRITNEPEDFRIARGDMKRLINISSARSVQSDINHTTDLRVTGRLSPPGQIQANKLSWFTIETTPSISIMN